MAIKGPSLSKEAVIKAVVNKAPDALARSYAYTVKREGASFTASVAELPELTHVHENPMEAQGGLTKLVVQRLGAMAEDERPVPRGIENKSAIDKSKEPPRHVKKAFSASMAK